VKTKTKRLFIRLQKNSVGSWNPRGEWAVAYRYQLLGFILSTIAAAVVWVLTKSAASTVFVGIGAAFLLPLGLGAWRYVRQRLRWRRKLCIDCGYDIRATTHRCPECGHVIHRPKWG